MATNILTESGTNEVEFLEFYIGDQSFAINVAKVMQIILFDDQKLTITAGSINSVMGTLLWRDSTIDLIDLNVALNSGKGEQTEKTERSIVLITNFNNVTSGFLISGVNRIHRMDWGEIHAIDTMLDKYSPRFTGTITIDEKNILLVDFESLIGEICATDALEELCDAVKSTGTITDKRNQKNLVFAEDSILIRANMLKYLEEAGYKVNAFENGQMAHNYIMSRKKQLTDKSKITDFVDLIITDIEMPVMDGLTLCRKVKEDTEIYDVPVMIFSSLINDQMAEKCKEVGANGYVSKPRSQQLISEIDKILSI